MSAEGTDLSTDVLSIGGDQPLPVFILIACRMQVYIAGEGLGDVVMCGAIR